MNERIRELAEQATIVGDTQHYMGIPSWYLEKFADLIIKETCNIILHYTDVDEGVAVAKKNLGVE